MRKVIVLFLFIALAVAATSVAQEPPRLTVDEIGTPLDTPELSNFMRTAVSPDGQWLAYVTSEFNERSSVFLKPLSGGEATLIYTFDQFAEQFKDDPDYYGGMLNRIRSLTFTPNSKEITFAIDIFDSDRGSSIRTSSSGIYFAVHSIPYIKSLNIKTQFPT